MASKSTKTNLTYHTFWWLIFHHVVVIIIIIIIIIIVIVIIRSHFLLKPIWLKLAYLKQMLRLHRPSLLDNLHSYLAPMQHGLLFSLPMSLSWRVQQWLVETIVCIVAYVVNHNYGINTRVSGARELFQSRFNNPFSCFRNASCQSYFDVQGE